MSNNHKKAKTDEEQKEQAAFDAVRLLLQSTKGLNRDAVQAALHGLDQELHKRRRDRKLQAKFSNTKKTTATTTTNTTTVATPNTMVATNTTDPAHTGSSAMEQDAPRIHSHRSEEDDDEEEDWQDIPDADHSNNSGNVLSKSAIGQLSKHNVIVPTPLAAIAVVLHATLLRCQFVCLGVPQPSNNTTAFAAPVRPIATFLPSNYTAEQNRVRLLYRKRETVELSVQSSSDDTTVMVQLFTNKEPSEPLTFALSEHVNLDSWKRATQNHTKAIPPALHYKKLSELLSQFVNLYDLGGIQDTVPESAPTVQDAYVDQTIRYPHGPFHKNKQPLGGESRTYDQPPFGPPEFHLPSLRRPDYGDFSSDLMPANTFLPPQQQQQPGGLPSGNWMGPNHALFQNNGGGVRPRYDPTGPPGGPQEDAHFGFGPIPNKGRPNVASRQNGPRDMFL